MKTKEFKDELNKLTTDELLAKEKQYKEELFNLRFQSATGQLENTARLSVVRKAIARIKTLLRQSEAAK
ncbi:50S ribosomal protein L29 [Ligilactobacillus pabuli]|uniref:Large ribosomal subunit protein uL29 n=1 Tax=Ligilactobacillus pabuli TaxID=2886039 RepID=A0ABQ5JF95_9LACO|nr:50S ribosomal protein L29 [Ligilactobacillus pabuli]GKS80682.1 50S ribosomal protein L29 [Ligilactobacillus pabuli]